jgi:ubiquinone/menaquinone biosynthesis C-methylase UbiE
MESDPNLNEKSFSARLRQAILSIVSSIAVENIDANSFKFFNMAEEHRARYRFVPDVLAKLGVTPSTIAEFGAGQGYGSAFLADSFKDAKVVGIDLNRESLEHAQQNYAGPRDNIELINGSVTNVPLATASANVVTCFEVYEHLKAEDQNSLLGEARRVLEDNGVLIMSVPEPYSRNIVTGNPRHLHEPSYEELLEGLNENGFELARLDGDVPAEFGQCFLTREQLNVLIKGGQYVPLLYPLYYYTRDPKALEVSSKHEAVNQDLHPVTHIIVARKKQKVQN